MKNSKCLIKSLLALLIGLSILTIGTNPTSHRSNRNVGPELIGAGDSAFDASSLSRTEAEAGTRARINDTYGTLPLSFEANEGQIDSRVKFLSRAGGQTLFLTSTDAVLMVGGAARASRSERPVLSLDADIQRPPIVESKASVLRMKLVAANPKAKASGLDELPGKSNYFIGNDPKKWRTQVSTYSKVRYHSVYRGIDLVYHGSQGALEYDFNVAPGTDPGTIRLSFEGVRRVRIDTQGDLLLETEVGEVRQHRPVVYQEESGARKTIAASFVMRNKNQVGFRVSRYDVTKQLVIDPVLNYSTYVGGLGGDTGYGIAVDSGGNAYVAGHTQSADFPTKNPLQAPQGFPGDAFVSKLNPSGTALVYSTYLGGSAQDQARSIAIDSAGNAYVTGFTSSTNFPTMNAFKPTHPTFDEDAFVAKINSSGAALVYSTYLGGIGTDVAQGIIVDSAGAAYVTGVTASSNFPTANPLQAMLLGSFDCFITKFNPSGSTLDYSTYVGGSGSDTALGIAVDSFGQAYVAGGTSSPDFPLANPIQSEFRGKNIFKSTDGGNQWASINTGLPVQATVTSLAADALQPSTVYAGTAGQGIFKSINGGAGWNAMNAGLSGSRLVINALAIDPRDSTIGFAATSSGVYKTTSSGSSWTLKKFPFALSVSIDPSNSSTVYAGTLLRGRISKSTNGGETWRDILVIGGGSSAGLLRAIAVDPITPSTIYVADGDNKLFKSVNAGVSWQYLTNGLFGGYKSLAIDPTTPSTVYAGSSGFGVFKSTDGGSSWFQSLSKLTPVNSLVIDPASTSIVYAGTSRTGVFKSTDSGLSWTSLEGRLPNSFVNALAIDPANTSTIYAGASAVGDGFALKLNAAGSAILSSTYLGGDDVDFCNGIALDSSGAVYVAGTTYSRNFPTVGPFQQSPAGAIDAFVAKLNLSSSSIVYAGYLGGNGRDEARGIAVDPGGNAYITGFTYSSDFPIISPLPGSAIDLDGNAFVTKLGPSGNLVFSTYLGGFGDSQSSDFDAGTSISVDSGGNAYIIGDTLSSTFPTTPGAFQVSRAGFDFDAFVSKLSVFDVCLQDETNGNVLQLNSGSGDYVLDDCRKGIRLTGRGLLSFRGCKIELRDGGPDPKRPDRNVLASVNTCTHSGTASATLFASGKTITVSDTNTANSTCLCSR